MENKVDSWLYEKPTEEGVYIVCVGDVESPQNLMLEYFAYRDGKLCDSKMIEIDQYHCSCKFAKLIFN